jgi:cell division inhibitor SepF
MEDKIMGLFDKILKDPVDNNGMNEDQYYTMTVDEAYKDQNSEGNKMILLEPRAYSESQQIADHLKKRNTIVVNLKRVTSEQAKRIIDFLSGTLYAIGGNMQKLGPGIFLCTPKNINVQGKMTEEEEKKAKTKDDDEE